MTTAVEQWLIDHPDTSCDYPVLVERMRSGEIVECLVSTQSGGRLFNAEHTRTEWGELFKLTMPDSDMFVSSVDVDFMVFCEQNDTLFAKQNFLKSTRKLLEIAKSAAEFKAIVLPINTREDVDVLLALLDRENESI